LHQLVKLYSSEHMQIKTVQPAKKFQDKIQKVTIFETSQKFIFRQKITPSPFTCVSYNHFDIPKFEVNKLITEARSRIQVTGPKTSDEIYALHNGKLFQILIELRPYFYYYLFNRSPQEIENKIIPLQDLVNPEKVNHLVISLSGDENSEFKISTLCDFLNDLEPAKKQKVLYIEEAISIIEKENGNVSVGSICNNINRSERQFNRKFTEVIGISPIQYIKIRQLHFVINHFQKHQHNFIKELAYDTGFYDPAHFNHSFKKLTGMSPGEFISSKDHVALDYFTGLL